MQKQRLAFFFMQHVPPVLLHNSACSSISWSPSSTWGVLAVSWVERPPWRSPGPLTRCGLTSLNRQALCHQLLRLPRAAGMNSERARGWRKLSARPPAGNSQKVPGWDLRTTAYQPLRPLPATFWEKITGGAALPFLGTRCHAAVPGWMVLQAGRLLLMFTDEAHGRPGSCQQRREESLLASRSCGWMGRWEVSHKLRSSAQARVAGWHRNTLQQQGSSRNVFIYIKTLLYKLKERKRRKKKEMTS